VRKFWNFTADSGENILHIDGYIAEQSWFDDDITPKQFAAELNNVEGNLTLWVNSGGGDCFAASRIYTMLQEHKNSKKCKVSVKIDALAASAASVICMAGDEVLMSPTALLMCHNPASLIFGEVTDLEKGIEMLNEVKESIINAYALKTGLDRTKISNMMDSETWMNATKATELGFADGMLYKTENETDDEASPFMWNSASMVHSVVAAMRKKLPSKTQQIKTGTPIENLDKRLSLLK